jgi:hypothetical protein
LKTRLKRYLAGKDLRSQLTASRLNEILAAIDERTPRTGQGTVLKSDASGFSYSGKPGVTSSAVVLPWKLSRGPDATAKVVIGFAYYGGQPYTPKIEGEAITADPAPMLPIEGSAVIWLRLKALFDGATEPVGYSVVAGEPINRGVVKNLQRKATNADRMFTSLVSEMNRAMTIDRGGAIETKTETPAWLSTIN